MEILRFWKAIMLKHVVMSRKSEQIGKLKYIFLILLTEFVESEVLTKGC